MMWMYNKWFQDSLQNSHSLKWHLHFHWCIYMQWICIHTPAPPLRSWIQTLLHLHCCGWCCGRCSGWLRVNIRECDVPSICKVGKWLISGCNADREVSEKKTTSWILECIIVETCCRSVGNTLWCGRLADVDGVSSNINTTCNCTGVKICSGINRDCSRRTDSRYRSIYCRVSTTTTSAASTGECVDALLFAGCNA